MNLKLYFVICIVVFLFAGVFTFSYIKISTENATPINQSTEVPPEAINIITPEIITPVEPVHNTTTETIITETDDSFIMPIKNGTVIKEFSGNNLVFSKTLNEWRVHQGIDIDAQAGTPVIASNAGYIKSIKKTVEHGIEITIEHKDGYKTIYSNLSSDNMVKIGEEIQKGQTISGVGRTATFEINEPDHLHFEMYKDDVLIDPMSQIS